MEDLEDPLALEPPVRSREPDAEVKSQSQHNSVSTKSGEDHIVMMRREGVDEEEIELIKAMALSLSDEAKGGIRQLLGGDLRKLRPNSHRVLVWITLLSRETQSQEESVTSKISSPGSTLTKTSASYATLDKTEDPSFGDGHIVDYEALTRDQSDQRK